MKISSRLIALAAKLDLGETYDSPSCGMTGSNLKKQEPYYPSIHVSGKPSAVDLQDEGHAIVKYKVTSRSYDESDGKKRHGATIKVHSIEHIDDDPKLQPKEGERAKVLPIPVPGVQFSDASGHVVTAIIGGKVMGKPLGRGMIEFGKGIRIRRGPIRIVKSVVPGELIVRPTQKAVPNAVTHEARSYVTDDVKDARATAASMIRSHRDPLRDPRRGWRGHAFSARATKILFGDPRPRNQEGQFSPVSEGVPSPHAMKAAYGHPVAAVGAGAGIGVAALKLLKKLRAKK